MNSLLGYRCKSSTRPLGAVAACVAGIVLMTGCGEKDGVKAKDGPAVPATSVVVTPVLQKTVPIFTELTARIDATDSVDIRARVKSFLLTQSYEEGKMVKAGQVLFTLDKREYEAQLNQAKAQLAKAQADLTQAQDRTVVAVAEANLNIALAQLNKTNQDVNRLKPLAALRAVPQQDYDNALAAQQGAKADVEGKQAGLNTAKVNQAAAIQQAQAAVEAANATIRQDEYGGPWQSGWASRGDPADHSFQCQSSPRLREHQRERLPDVSAHERRRQVEE
jgi:multidrug efflux pump subunit AcrA (membrane-fusion protein)